MSSVCKFEEQKEEEDGDVKVFDVFILRFEQREDVLDYSYFSQSLLIFLTGQFIICEVRQSLKQLCGSACQVLLVVVVVCCDGKKQTTASLPATGYGTWICE